MQLQYSYYKDALQSSMIIRLPGEEQDQSGYHFRMLAANRISGLAPCTIRHVDGDTLLYYETTATVSLASLCARRKLDAPEIRALLYELAGMTKTLSSYLLDADRLLLAPEFVFYRISAADEGKYVFVYYPAEIQTVRSVHAFYQFLSENADLGDKQTAMAVLALSELSEGENFILSETMLNGWYEDPGCGPGLAADPGDFLYTGPDKNGNRYQAGWEEAEDENIAGEEALHDTVPDAGGTGQEKQKERSSLKHAVRIIFIVSVLFLLSGLGMTVFRMRMPAAFEWALPAEAAVLILFAVSAVLSVLGAVLAFRSDRKEGEERDALQQQKEREEMVEVSFP